MLSGLKFFGNLSGFKLRSSSGFFLKFINRAGRVDQILFASVEWMAIRANFNMQLLFGRAGDKVIAAGANDLGIRKILWVDRVLHNSEIISHIDG